MSINPKTLSEWLGKFRAKVMTGPPSNKMRDRAVKIPDLNQGMFNYVLTNNLLGGAVTDASISNAAKDAFKAMQARRQGGGRRSVQG